MTNRTLLKLRYRLAAPVILSFLCRALSAQAPAAPSSQLPLEWKTYSNSSDGFTVSFPGTPDVSRQRVPSESGTLELRTYLVTPGSSALYVGVCDYGAVAQGRDPQTVLAGAEKGAIDNVKAHLTTEHKITLGAYPGVDFEADSNALHFAARLYLVGATLYEVLTASSLDDRFAGAKRFMDSFQLIPRAAN